MNLVLSLFSFGMLLFIQILMSSIQASTEDEISSHLSHVFKVMSHQVCICWPEVDVQRSANELIHVGTTLGQHTISLAQCWAYVGYTLFATLSQRRTYEQNYVVSMLVFNVAPTSSLMSDQRWA